MAISISGRRFRGWLGALAVPVALAWSGQVAAAAFTFTAPDLPLPATTTTGNGLTGQLWNNVDPGTDTLAQAEAIIAGGFATANFLSTTVDYPAGSAGAASVFATYNDILDATGKTTIDNTAVLTDDVLNTVMRFAGFFGVFEANEVWTFSILSDDGSAVDISGTRILSNDGIHAFGGPSTTVEFTAPGLYALDIEFFESQPVEFGLEFRGGLANTTPTTAISDRLYNLIDFGAPDDPRLDTIEPTNDVPEPGMSALFGLGLFAIRFARGRRANRATG